MEAEFETIVGPLAGDRAWRRQMRVLRARMWASWAGSVTLRSLAEVGCVFTGVPAQRCRVVRPASVLATRRVR
ncbi:MAG: hypothetical protein K1X38_15840 [Microthrixaceae bacterium]|nr:hypothetical protein [Microthrixaceae bacterium]